MKRQKQLNKRTLQLLQKEADRVQYLQDKIRKHQSELYDIYEKNSWIRYLDGKFWEGASEEERIEFNKLTKIIINAR